MSNTIVEDKTEYNKTIKGHEYEITWLEEMREISKEEFDKLRLGFKCNNKDKA